MMGMVVFGWETNDFIMQDIPQDIDVSKDPLQMPSNEKTVIMNSKDGIYTLTPVATYEISAKVVSVRTYNDNMEISPIDICTVWGQMADETNISYSQSERYCSYHYRSVPSFGEYYMLTHFSNNHIIPASSNVSSAFNSIKVNDKITMRGFLVDVKDEKGYSWKTSQTRYDSGYGGCEIIYVTQVGTGNRVWK